MALKGKPTEMFYIVTHKKFEQPREKGYVSILAGAALHGHIFGDLYDDAGDSISGKNPSYCELTALYWIWKNRNDPYIGICHYRRYFSGYWDDSRILTEKDALRILKNYDVILPQTAHLSESVREEYIHNCGRARDLDTVRKIIAEQCPSYLPYFDSYMSGHTTTYKNMMVCSKERYDEYCSWLFPILSEMEKYADFTGYSSLEKRMYGLLAERLLNVYIRKNGWREKHLFILEPERKLSAGMKLIYRIARVTSFYL